MGEIAGMTGTTPFHSTVNLKAVSHRSIGTGYQPSQFMESIDHYTTPDNFGPWRAVAMAHTCSGTCT